MSSATKKKNRAAGGAAAPDSMLLVADPFLPLDTFIALARKYHHRIKQDLIAGKVSGLSGRDFVRAYSASVDALVKLVFERAVCESDVDPRSTGIAVIAMGGYGRAELAPYSDVDLLILCKRKTALAKRVAGSFVRLLWDVGFELGHSVQSPVESEGVIARNFDARTALIESRWLCGSRELARVVSRQITRLKRSDRELFIKRKIKDALKRHDKYGGSYQLVEPNVKLSPGGLRDYHTLVWMGMVFGGRGVTGLDALRKKGFLLPGETTALERAYDFLLRTRVELHLASRSKQDHLTVKMQRTITRRLGYGTRGDHLDVELFMRDYYMHTRTVYHIIEDVLEELEHGANVRALTCGRKPRSVLALSMRLDRGRIRREPLYVFERQKREGLKLDRALKRRLEEALETTLKGRAHTMRMRRSFLSLFEDGGNLSLALRSMHETGFLGRIIPEYDRLTCLKRYDLYHHYTADEHSFRVVRNLEELGSSHAKRPAPLARIYSEAADKRLLYLAAFLHDIGKVEGRGHAKKGAVLARKILKRLRVDPDTTENVAFLIEKHLLMSHFSQRRDPTDIGTLQAFCARVKNRTNLKLLALLTYADLKATSPIVWTKWKGTLLWNLYLKSCQFMAKKDKKPDAVYKARKRAILRAFAEGEEKRRALAHLDLLPGRYLLTMNPSQVKRHMELIDRLDGCKGIVATKTGKATAEVTFCTFDKPYRLSELCGVLAVNDLNILFAFAFTRKDGKVIDIFQVESLVESSPIDEARIARIQSDLDDVLAGRQDIRKTFERHISRWKRRMDTTIPVPVKVEFENDLSNDFTIIDIFAPDVPGLLYRITRALSAESLSIFRARISTEANRAIDAFYVQEAGGGKVKSASRIRRIRKTLEKALDARG